MINFAKSRAEIAAMPGDLVAVPKTQMAELLDAAERGQHAERLLTGIKAISAIGASPYGLAA